MTKTFSLEKRTPPVIKTRAVYTSTDILEATPHNHRHTPLYAIYLHIFRHITQIYLEIRQYSCGKFRQSDEKSDYVSGIQWLCGVALIKTFTSHHKVAD